MDCGRIVRAVPVRSNYNIGALRSCSDVCGSIVVIRREAGIGQIVLSSREEGYGCCSKELLLSCNSIGKM